MTHSTPVLDQMGQNPNFGAKKKEYIGIAILKQWWISVVNILLIMVNDDGYYMADDG